MYPEEGFQVRSRRGGGGIHNDDHEAQLPGLLDQTGYRTQVSGRLLTGHGLSSAKEAEIAGRQGELADL